MSTNWKGLTKNPEWLGSSAHKHSIEYLRGQLRFKGTFLAKRVKAALEGASERDVLQLFDDEVDTPQPTPQKSTRAKRGHASDVDDPEHAAASNAPAKKQKTEQHDEDASLKVLKEGDVI